ncbi:MAG: hypothetical protein GAK30_03261 [Paracidovorax wautersii]|uniref:Uncharacterized protein n=1 Tax=Paracidovorax wautersii TaxID=1177982 RepID=A0A7V8FLI5_9BURK|nr:MAG: hypothetical protein GAK30_03261 [Paracidovorax wautersii]
MDIVINEKLKAYIDPLTPEEHDALERSILAEGCRDALVLWGDVLVDDTTALASVRSTACRSRPCRTRGSSRWKTCTCG